MWRTGEQNVGTLACWTPALDPTLAVVLRNALNGRRVMEGVRDTSQRRARARADEVCRSDVQFGPLTHPCEICPAGLFFWISTPSAPS